MEELKDNKRRNGKLSLYPLKFKEAVEDLLKVKPVNNLPQNDGKQNAKV